MVRRARLDSELVRRGLARSREQAAEFIATGRVVLAGVTATKPASAVTPDTPLLVRPPADGGVDYVSRGGHKLAGALARFTLAPEPLRIAGAECLDAGASTGGFTDVLLRAGATRVVAVDVGYGQLAWSLRRDERVDVRERTNVRSLTPDDIGGPVAITVADLSFIGLRTVLPSLVACTRTDGNLVVLVKPQFEVGRERLGPGGVVRDPDLRAEAVLRVASAAQQHGLRARGVVASSLPGPQGNVEYLLWLAGPGAPAPEPQQPEAIRAAVQRAIEAGPS